jgi:flagellar basal body P-ring protein FlgI
MDCFGVRVRPHALAACASLVLALVGCSQQQTRLQSPEDPERDRYEVRTVGEVTQVGNATGVPVGGVGLVTGLEGTGGEAPAGEYRTMLEKALRQQGVKDVKKVLADRDNAMVIVTGVIPPGARKGDPIDLEVRLPPRSKAASLRGGHLEKCLLYNYDNTRHLSPNSQVDPSILIGHPIVVAEGSVLAGFGDGNEADRQRVGRVWGGGRCRRDFPLSLTLNQPLAALADQIARRVNANLQVSKGAPDLAIAVAVNHQMVNLQTPPQYRLNLQRFLLVTRLVPRNDVAEPSGGGRSYRQRLADDLMDPARTVVAALRLEALGTPSIPLLKNGLSSEHELVRFCSAEALAYLGCAKAGEELAAAAEKRPLFRAFALTALAALDENVSRDKLLDLIAGPFDDDCRYGAFRALSALEEDHPAIRGERLNDSFWLHRVAPASPPLVHLSSVKRAEVVLFGQDPELRPPFAFAAGEFVVTATPQDDRCTVSRVAQQGGDPVRVQCPLRLEAVIRTVAGMEGTYPEVVDILQQADATHTLSCRVVHDALPQAVSMQELAGLGSGKGVEAGPDLGPTPTLFEGGRRTTHPATTEGAE